jgi:hypothetical protein
LGDLLGQLRGANLSERGGENEVEVTPDDFSEIILGVVSSISGQQLEVGIGHLHKYIGTETQIGQKN